MLGYSDERYATEAIALDRLCRTLNDRKSGLIDRLDFCTRQVHTPVMLGGRIARPLRPDRGRGAVQVLTTVIIAAVLIGPSATANGMSVKEQLGTVAHEFDAPAAQAADRAGASSQCPLTLAQVGAALPLSTGIQERSLATGCVFYTGTLRDFAVGRQLVLLYISESKGRIGTQWLSGMSSRLCSAGAGRNANGNTAYSLCGITSKQRRRYGLSGSPVQRGLAFDFQTPDHKFVWIVSLTYKVQQNGFRTQDPETGLLAALKSFS